MKPLTTVLALAAMFTLGACADQPTAKAHFAATDGPMQLSSASAWQEAIAAQTAAHVSNNNLIMMR